MEEEIVLYSLDQLVWELVILIVLLQEVLEFIVFIVVGVEKFFIIVGYIGCNYGIVEQFVMLVESVFGI